MKVRSNTLSSWILLLGTMAPMPSAEQAKGLDALIRASTQAAHAKTLLERCSHVEAEEWLHRALETARGSRSVDSIERDTAGSLVARLEIQLAELRKQRKQLDREANELSRLVSAGWLETAHGKAVLYTAIAGPSATRATSGTGLTNSSLAHHDRHPLCRRGVGQQALQSRAIDVGAGVATVVVLRRQRCRPSPA